MQAARDNVKDPPGIFVKVGLESLRGAHRFIEEDLPRAFSALDDLHILGDLADTSMEAAAAIGATIRHLEEEIAPRARGSFRLGRDTFEQKLRLEEGITLDAEARCSSSTIRSQRRSSSSRSRWAPISSCTASPNIWADTRI